jgi:hypothetical protein
MSEKRRFQKKKLNKTVIKEKEKKAGRMRLIGKGAIGGGLIGLGMLAKKAGPAVVENAPKALAAAKQFIKL